MSEDVVAEVEGRLGAEPIIDLQHHPLRLDYRDGVLTLEGDLPSVAAKRLALDRATATPGVTRLVDQLHVEPAQRMDDDVLRQHVLRLLADELALRQCALAVRVDDGVVTLEGNVPSLAHKRLAGVLTWWVPGTRDVNNVVTVSPPELDSDDEIADAVWQALEMDPFVDAGDIQVRVHEGVVTLDGTARSRDEREMAESDAWFVLGVAKVDNRLVSVVPVKPATD